MLNKKLQAAVNINNDGTFLPVDLKELYLEYYIIESELIDEEQNFHGKSYGVEIIKKELGVNNNIYIENKLIDNIYCCESKTKELIDKLVYYTVTPVTLNNVLEDMIGVI
ncbi:MAG: hypothetical protein JG777_323 [Clostridia bacterium]|uniref:DUF6514 family protein n=1 Tax=Petroclostridium xylanilyticum TaxID=1792311 RepID=UPI000B980AC4|nr:DUF6514 family protein [Petroclostridium xylanilyticum]MBZ4644834.1 hypothetical protein [Clostridia bacterium]